jgi:hypothetical protein
MRSTQVPHLNARSEAESKTDQSTPDGRGRERRADPLDDLIVGMTDSLDRTEEERRP